MSKKHACWPHIDILGLAVKLRSLDPSSKPPHLYYYMAEGKRVE